MLNFTTKGYIEVYRDGVLISQHTQETKAVESAAQHADAHGDGEYRFRYPEKVLRVIGTLAPSTDTQAPTQPTNLVATAVNRQRIDLSWTASTDNVGVAGYQIFRNGSPLDVATTNSYTDSTVTASTTYTYSVVAFDSAGNNSTASSSAQATTPANATPTWTSISAQTLIVGRCRRGHSGLLQSVRTDIVHIWPCVLRLYHLRSPDNCGPVADCDDQGVRWLRERRHDHRAYDL
jgi:hypothetical protein